ncbi:hypothetical protein FH972_024734 [Carpinus fangiana]|uniref:Uncharacterized protein n=1 Tax=Carpinus fangiana TaxID=176857 RepID=A0A5N6KZ87_9ROSI|nr:hypothetical protein FH972_024734 [Carpinus fangiana]
MSSGKSREVAMNWGFAEIDRSNPNPNFSFGYMTKEKDLKAFSVVMTVKQWKIKILMILGHICDVFGSNMMLITD